MATNYGPERLGLESVGTAPTAAQLEQMAAAVDQVRERAQAEQAERDRAANIRRIADDQRRLESLTAELRAVYLEIPGRSSDDFDQALPGLLEEVAREETLGRLSGTHGVRSASPLTGRRIVPFG